MAKTVRTEFWSFVVICLISLLAANNSWAQRGTTDGQWPAFGGDPGNTKFAPLDQINADNFRDLKINWRWSSISQDVTKKNRKVRWDYDLPTAPNLVDIDVDGESIKAIAQISKQGFTYVFDRATGKPVWPIEEREVPASSVPGEKSSPTQPFPTKPPPFERQGITEDDLIDLTSELKKEALEIVASDYTIGPLFTPPRTKEQGKPVVNLPGDGGGANWPGAAFDPESGQLFIPSSSTPKILELGRPDAARSDLDFIPQGWTSGVRGPQGLPLIKPPYVRITAIDMNAGEHTWMSPHGDGPRNHPAIKELNLGPLGGGGFHAGGPLVTKTLLIVAHGGRDVDPNEGARCLSVYDKINGEYLGSIPLPSLPYGNPITYMHNDKQWIAVAVGGGRFLVGGGGDTPELIGLSLPKLNI